MSAERGRTRSGEARLHAVEWAQAAGAERDVLAAVERRLARRRRRWRAAGGAGVMLALVAAGWAWRRVPVAPATAPRLLAVSESPRHLRLPDGSEVELRPGAEVQVAFAGEVRRIVLLQGEAHFAVVKDPARPFVVATEQVQVRAVGTAFSVRRSPEGIQLLVTEGSVALERAGGAGAVPTTLALVDAGKGAAVSAPAGASPPRARVEEVSASEIARRLSWRAPLLEFSGTPLAEVLPQFERHAGVRFTLARGDIGAIRLSGVIRATNVDTLLRVLAEEHGLTAERALSGDVRLSRSADSGGR